MRWWVLAVIGFAAGLACSLADELQGAACRSGADCDKSQTCVFTLHQVEQPDAVGTCSKDGMCVAGDQVGCSCNSDRGCPGSGLFAIDHPTLEDGNGAQLCFCCPGTSCSAEEEVVIAGTEVGTARCMCCPVCASEELQDRTYDGDDNVLTCECLEPEDPSTGPTSSSS